jgi:hypothetical protein
MTVSCWSSNQPSTYPPINPFIHPSLHPPIHSSIHPSRHLHPFNHPFIHPPIHPSTHPPIHSSINSNLYSYLQEGACRLFGHLSTHHKIWVPVVHHDGQLLVRLSANVYSTPDDFRALGKVVKELQRQREGEGLGGEGLELGEWDL